MDIAAEMIGDGARHRGRAVHGGEDADVVARGDAAVLAHDALEARRPGGRGRRLRLGAVGMVAREVTHRQVVRVHMLPRADRLAREADDLPVAAHGGTRLDRALGHLVARRNQAGDGNAFARDVRPRDQLVERDHDIVIGVQAYHARVRREARGQHGRCRHSTMLKSLRYSVFSVRPSPGLWSSSCRKPFSATGSPSKM